MKIATFALAAGILFAASPALAENLTFTLTNSSSSAVTGFYVSRTSTKSWEENLIDGSVLPSGKEIDVEIADGRSVCEYDVKATFEDGTKLEDYNINLCELGAYTVEDAD